MKAYERGASVATLGNSTRSRRSPTSTAGYVLACKGLRSTKEIPVEKAFERLFREYSLPHAIRTDNGVPFATIALGRLSRLSVWWIKLGIRPELTQPSHPEQNGQHERMHRTLKAETTRPPGKNLEAQQKKFDCWRREFNDDRPHESLQMEPPSTLYAPSCRPYPKKIEHQPNQPTSKCATSAGTTAFGGTDGGST